MSAQIANLLSRLSRVRETGSNCWTASCPGPSHANGDRTPSLAIRETADGLILLRCFVGCEVEDIIQAIGMDLPDLFPDNPSSPSLEGRPTTPPKLRAAHLIRLAAYESTLVALVCGDILAGKPVSPDDILRAKRGVEALSAIHLEIYCG